MRPEDCRKFERCGANVCPLEPADWQKRSHLPGDPTCHYLRLAAKGAAAPMEEGGMGLAAGLVRETLASMPSPSRFGALRRELDRAARLPPKRGPPRRAP
jgi:hypothetical protein